MTNLVTLGSDNKLIIDQDKLQEMMKLKNYPAEQQAQYLQQAVNQSLVHQAGLIVQAALLDRDQYRDRWLQQKRSMATKDAYRKAINDFFSYLDRNGIASPVLVTAEHADDYLEELKQRYSDNSIRARVSSCGSFYSYLKRLRKIDMNPFHGIPLPKKHYKKAIKPDQVQSIPVMNREELKIVLDVLDEQMNIKGSQSYHNKIRSGSKKLYLAVHLMSSYGLRAGAVQTIEVQGESFSYVTKGEKSGTKRLEDETMRLLSQFKIGRRPFSEYKKISMQVAFKKLSRILYEEGRLRYPYSCHDLRHHYAHEHYKKYKDIVQLRNELDHASINVTDVYLCNIGLK